MDFKEYISEKELNEGNVDSASKKLSKEALSVIDQMYKVDQLLIKWQEAKSSDGSLGVNYPFSASPKELQAFRNALIMSQRYFQKLSELKNYK